MRHRPPARTSLRAARAAMALLSPTPERLTHGRVRRAKPGEVIDDFGAYALPHVAESLLGRLERRGDIDAAQRLAGEAFAEVFHRASLDPLHAGSLDERIDGVGGSPSQSAEHARRELTRALTALGGMHSPAGCCAWYVLGLQMSIAAWSQREGWNGRRLSEHVAKGILLACLGILEAHFAIAARHAARQSA
jgi:hypothetical protein